MLSRCLRTATRLTFRNFSRINTNFNKYHFEKPIIQFHRWESNMYTPHNPYVHDSNKGAKNPMQNTLNQQNRDKDNNLLGKPSNAENMPFNQKLNNPNNRRPYASEREDENRDENPEDVMFQNVSKDEDMNPKDNHFNEDSLKNSSGDRNLGRDNLFDMTLIQNQNKMDKNKLNLDSQNRQAKEDSHVKDINEGRGDFNTSKTGLNHGFQKFNQDENFNDIYVGDVEHKIPSKNLNAHHKQVVTEHMKNKDINKDKDKDTSGLRYGKHSPIQDSQYSVDDHDNYEKKRNANKNVDKNQQKSNMMDSNVDLDLSTGTFNHNLKQYEKKMSSKDDTSSSSSSDSSNLNKTPSNEDYFLKDNNSEYNKFTIDEKNKNKDKKNKINRNDTRYNRSKDDFDLDIQPNDESKYSSSSNKQM